MDIFLNDKKITLPETSISVTGLLKQQALSGNGIAIAINQEVIRKSEWDKTMIKHNDKIIIITATQGG